MASTVGEFLLLGRRPFREARVRAYIVREHRSGRHLGEILGDPYLARCGTERFCRSVAHDPHTLALLAEDVRRSLEECRP